MPVTMDDTAIGELYSRFS